MKTTTIRINQKTKSLLDKIKIHPRETYENILLRILKVMKGGKTTNGKNK